MVKISNTQMVGMGLVVTMLILALTLPHPVFSAAQETIWTHTYGGSENDYCFDLIQTNDGGFALTGFTSSYGQGWSDAWLVKTDSEGLMQWNRIYGGAKSDSAEMVIQTTDGGYALAGETASFGAGSSDWWLVKTDTDGQIQWNQTYGGSSADEALAIIQTPDAGFVLTGYIQSIGDEFVSQDIWRDLWLVKTDANGVMQWNQTYGDDFDDWGCTLIQSADGSFVIAGVKGFNMEDKLRNGYAWLLKTDTNGVMQWNQTYFDNNGVYTSTTMGGERPFALIQTVDGGYALAGGNYYQSGGKHRKMWLMKTDTNGELQWNQSYGLLAAAQDLIQTVDGGYALAGYTESFGAGWEDMWLVKTDANGIMQWDQTYGGDSTDEASALIQTKEGEYVLAGRTTSFGGGNSDFWLIKTESGSLANLITIPFEIFVISIGFVASYAIYRRYRQQRYKK